jgi:hypothetical protein
LIQKKLIFRYLISGIVYFCRKILAMISRNLEKTITKKQVRGMALEIRFENYWGRTF